jgi:PDZ domain-containing secreted protein
MSKRTKEREIRIRAVAPGCQGGLGNGIRYFVESETKASITLDNRARENFRLRFTLAKRPDGRLENSVGQQYEIVTDSGVPVAVDVEGVVEVSESDYRKPAAALKLVEQIAHIDGHGVETMDRLIAGARKLTGAK